MVIDASWLTTRVSLSVRPVREEVLLSLLMRFIQTTQPMKIAETMTRQPMTRPIRPDVVKPLRPLRAESWDIFAGGGVVKLSDAVKLSVAAKLLDCANTLVGVHVSVGLNVLELVNFVVDANDDDTLKSQLLLNSAVTVNDPVSENPVLCVKSLVFAKIGVASNCSDCVNALESTKFALDVNKPDMEKSSDRENA